MYTDYYEPQYEASNVPQFQRAPKRPMVTNAWPEDSLRYEQYKIPATLSPATVDPYIQDDASKLPRFQPLRYPDIETRKEIYENTFKGKNPPEHPQNMTYKEEAPPTETKEGMLGGNMSLSNNLMIILLFIIVSAIFICMFMQTQLSKLYTQIKLIQSNKSS